MDQSKENIKTFKVKAGKRIYFFDVKSTRTNNDIYMVITESKRVDEQKFEKHKIFLFKEDFEKFRNTLLETLDYAGALLQKEPQVEKPIELPVQIGADTE